MKPLSTPYSEALKRLRRFVEMSDAKPISQREDRIYGIHAGTEWEAEVRLSDIRAIVAAAVSEQQRFHAVGYIDTEGCVKWEPNKDPSSLSPGQLVYVSHLPKSAERPD